MDVQQRYPHALWRPRYPDALVFKGGQVKEQIVGYVPKETIQKVIDKHV